MGIIEKIKTALEPFNPFRIEEKAIGSGYRTVGTSIPTGYDFASGTQFLNFIQLDALEDSPRRIVVQSAYLQNSWVYSAVQIMALNFAQAEWKIMQGEGKESIEVLPNKGQYGWVPRLFQYVSPTENRYSLWESVLVWMALAGECLWQMKRATTNQIAEIDVIPPTQMTNVVASGKLIGWKRSYDGIIENIPAEDIIQFKYFNPYNKWRGLSPLTAAALGINVDFAASLYNYYFFNNDSTPVGIIKSDQDLTTEEADAAEIRWAHKTRGPSKKGRVPVLGKGMEYKSIALAQKDIQYIEQKKWSREEVFAVLNVPPALSQVLEFASIKSNIKEQRQQLWENNLIPKKKFIEDVMRTQFFELENISHLRGKFDITGISALKETIAEKVTSAKALFEMGVPLNAINEKLELGFDEFDWGDQGYISGILVPAGQESQGEIVPAKEPPPGKQVEKSVTIKKRRNPTIAAENLLGTVYKQEKKLREELQDYFRKMRSEVLGKIYNKKSIKSIEDHIVNDIMPDFGEYDDELGKIVLPIYSDVFEISLNNINRAMGTNVSMSTARANVVINNRFINIREINDTIRDQIRQDIRPIIRDAVNRGDAYETVAGRLADEVKNIFNNVHRRTATVARTEINGTLNEARWETMKEVGVEKHQWISTRQIRESHILNHLEIRTMGEYFPSGIRYPYDPDGPPSELINCSCISVPIME